MNGNIAEWGGRLRRALRSQYVRLLEEELERAREEVARLRQENRALLNSVLGTAGVPPIETPPLHPASIPPVRRRRWPEIAAARERDAARRARNLTL